MRTLITLSLALSFIPAVRGQDAARALIEKAIQAHGGAALDKYPAGVAKGKGTIVLKGTDYPLTFERVFQTPGKLRLTYEVSIMGVARPVTYAINGNTVSAVAGGLPQELPKSQVEELRFGSYIQAMSRLSPLLKDKKYKLAPAGEKTIEGKAAEGVTVSSEGHKDVKLYFDRQTNLLIAIERPGFDDQGKPSERLDYFSDYREANGLKFPVRTIIKQNGKRYLDIETTDFKPLEKVDSREFQIVPS